MISRHSEGFEQEAILSKPIYRPRQRIVQVSLCLNRIVKHDDGTVAGITFHIAEHLLTRQFITIIARHDVPHDNAEIFLQQFGLSG